jgi:hypothetical protein
MSLKRWHLGVLAVATVPPASLVLPSHPTLAVAAIVAVAGLVSAGLLHTRARRIQSELETLAHRLFAAGERERAAAEAERSGYLGRLRNVRTMVDEQQRALAELLEELDRREVDPYIEAVPDRPADAEDAVAGLRVAATA